MSSTTFNPNDKTGISLSNNNLTASITTEWTNGVRSTTSRVSGKVYLEFTFGQVAITGWTRVGCANSSWDETQSISLGRNTNSFAYQSDGAVFVANSIQPNLSASYTAGDTVQLCIDF